MSQKTNSGARDPAEFAVVSDDPLDVVPCAALRSSAIPRSSGSCLRVPLREVWPPFAHALVGVGYSPSAICRIATSPAEFPAPLYPSFGGARLVGVGHSASVCAARSGERSRSTSRRAPAGVRIDLSAEAVGVAHNARTVAYT